MNDKQKAAQEIIDAVPAKRWFPTKLTFWTLLAAGIIFFLHWQAFYLNERFNWDPGGTGLITMLLTLITVLAWGIWALFSRGLRLVGLLILAAPVVFLTLYYPNFLGDANIAGWKPRFWGRDVEFKSVADDQVENLVDLKSTSAADFPQFLGQNRNAVVTGIQLETDWVVSPPEQLWKQPIGEGWSGFAVVNGYAITQEQRADEECVTCYDVKTGELIWINSNKRRHEDTMAMGKVGPRATPTIHEGRVYVTSGTGVLDCLDGATGELIWTADVPAMVGIKQVVHTNSMGLDYTTEDSRYVWGRSSSPLIYEDKVIVPAGGPREDPDSQTCTMIAFDKLTGQEIWRGGKRMASYGSPSVETILGQPQILLVAESAAVGHDPATGEELWNFERPGHTGQDANCSQVTVVSPRLVILSKGYSLGGELVELKKTDGEITARTIKKDPRVLKTKLTSPVLKDGFAYSLSDGYLECTEAESLKRRWKQRGRFGNGQLLLVGDKLLVHTETGKLLLVGADPAEYWEYGSIPTIEGICWNTISLYKDMLLVRSELEAACYKLPTSLIVTESNSNGADFDQ
jgi:outer membrane protein assembly factor BamB